VHRQSPGGAPVRAWLLRTFAPSWLPGRAVGTADPALPARFAQACRRPGPGRSRRLPAAYALHFGMAERDQLPLAGFAHAWVAAFASLPGWHQLPARRPDFDEPDAVAKPSIDEHVIDPNVGLGIWLTGGGA
jgi:hypothetical protein